MDTAGGDIGGHQHRHRAGGEGGQGTGPGRLGQVAMQGAGPDAGTVQLAGEAGGAVLGTHEHQGPARAARELGATATLSVAVTVRIWWSIREAEAAVGATVCRTGSVR